ncbi:MAG: DNA gyrase inhibitor YacG [Betaproteobacteria bacterium]
MNFKLVRCPQCGKSVEYRPENVARPFCSPRCKLLDLGAWAEEKYAIAANAGSNDLAELTVDDCASELASNTGPAS